MPITAKIIKDSISQAGDRIATLQLLYPRFIHSELMTHRVFSRNASSSRAIPVKRMLEMIRNEPAMPIHWGKNQPGMQAHEQLTGNDLRIAQDLWINAAGYAAHFAEAMMNLGLHKQVANRILEPFQHISVVLTATEWSNWDELRDHEDADPNIHELARQIKLAREASTPKLLLPGEWHLPYVEESDRADLFSANLSKFEETELLRKISAARCCRVSYLKHDGTTSTLEEDLALCDRLAAARPIHASPFEHQATPMTPGMGFAEEGVSHIDFHGKAWSGNFKGWIQHRKLIEASFA